MALPFHVEQRIEAPPDRVWAFVLDISQSGRWMRDTVSIEMLDPGPFGVGSRFRQTRRMYGREASEEFTVTRFDAQARRLDLEVDGRKGSAGRGVFRFRYEMRAAGPATVVVLDGEIDALGRVVELVASFFVGNFVKVVERDLDGLRMCLEEGRSFAAPVTTSSTSRAPST
jgi:carbon monoxide dehydrogenase subunit G